MSFMCANCGGLALEGEDHNQTWGYGGRWCACATPRRQDMLYGRLPFDPAHQTVPIPPLTESDVRRIIREELDRRAHFGGGDK